jgi:hypothetical protein
MTQPSPTYLLIEQRLGKPLADFIGERRPHTAWRRIAMEILKRTDVDVTYETLRTWFSADESSPERETAA